MAGDYEIWLTSDSGKRIRLIDDFLYLQATWSDKAIGTMSLGLKSTFNADLLQPDYMIQIWRAPEGGHTGLWRTFFIRKWRFETTGAEERLKVVGRDAKDLLRRRIVAYYTGEAEAGKTDFADDMMKEIVTEMMTDSNPATDAGSRLWDDLSVEADASAGPTLTATLSWRKVWEVIPALQAASREAGTEVFFDIVPDEVSSTSISFVFRTRTGQPGMDRTDVIFSQRRGNLQNPFLEFDYGEEENYIYSGGQGQEDSRNIQQVYDTTRYNASQWNRCEGFAVATQQAADNGVREVGRAQLEAGRPRRRFGANAIDTAGTRFGRDWNFGDKVTAVYRGFEFESVIRIVSISLQEGSEQITARLEYED